MARVGCAIKISLPADAYSLAFHEAKLIAYWLKKLLALLGNVIGNTYC